MKVELLSAMSIIAALAFAEPTNDVSAAPNDEAVQTEASPEDAVVPVAEFATDETKDTEPTVALLDEIARETTAKEPAPGPVESLGEVLTESADGTSESTGIVAIDNPEQKAEEKSAGTIAAEADAAATNEAPIADAGAQPQAIPEPPAAPSGQQQAEQPVAEATQAPKEYDEIDLDDDSAIAAKKTRVNGNLDKGINSLVDIECDEATLADVIRQFRKTTGANIICGDYTNLQRRISVTLKKVPWLDAMSAILNSRGFRIEDRENIYRVVEDVQIIPVSTRTYTLNHASSKELADLFNKTYARKDAAGKVIGQIASSFEGANVVVVTATDKILSECEAIVKAVDRAIPQIYIEARFLELSSQAMHKLGMQWDSLESWGVTVNNISGGMEYNKGRIGKYGTILTTSTVSANDNQTADSTTKTQSSSKTLEGLAPENINQATGAGRSAESMGWHTARGFSGQFSADDFRLAMSAFEKLGEGKVFSNPKVIVSNGKEAHVDMTTKFPNVELTSQRNTSTTTPYTDVSTKIATIPGDADKTLFGGDIFYSWGITLEVKPRISPDGLISVEISPTISQLDTSVSASGFYQVQSSSTEVDSPYSMYPIIDMKRIETEFTMKDGATAVIGGLSRTSEEDIDSGIPYLRKIPWIGPKLFGWKSRQKVQKEIIVCVTIGIANPAELPTDIGLPKNAVLGREYVTGTRLEPGDRIGSSADLLKIDTRLLDDPEKIADEGRPLSDVNLPPKGTVTITTYDEE